MPVNATYAVTLLWDNVEILVLINQLRIYRLIILVKHIFIAHRRHCGSHYDKKAILTFIMPESLLL